MVLWGKSKDKPPSEQIEKDLAMTTTDEQMTAKDETTKIQNQELEAIDGTSGKPKDELV